MVECMLLRAERRAARWYAVPDPASLGCRITLSGAFPSQLYVIGKRLDDREPLGTPPQQSDYVATWEAPQTRWTPQVSRIPDLPAPVVHARQWLNLFARRTDDTRLHAVRLDDLAREASSARCKTQPGSVEGFQSL